MPVNGVAVAAIGAGTILVWSGINNKGILVTAKDIVSGQKPVPGPSASPPPGTETSINQSLGIDVPVPGISTNFSANQATARLLAAPYGWSAGSQWNAFVDVVNRESGWDNEVYNGGAVGGPYQPNKAYGIAQALGHGPNGAPYPAGNLGNPPGAGGISSAAAQISWMLSYIRNEYGTPEGALNSENTRGYY
jgi:hypothetical protein